MDVLPQGALLISLATSLSCMQNLRALKITSLVSAAITLGQPPPTWPLLFSPP